MKTSEKLLQLADFLDDKVPDERFNFAWWGVTAEEMDAPPSCGTTACAAGWLDEASGGECRAWHKNSYGLWHFDQAAARDYLGLDVPAKPRNGEKYGWDDFYRLFMDGDGRLANRYGGLLQNVPKSAVTARIRACAASYAKRGR